MDGRASERRRPASSVTNLIGPITAYPDIVQDSSNRVDAQP